MSGKVMEWACRLQAGLGHAEARVLLILASHADDDGTNVYPALKRIEAYAEASRSTVARCLARLEELGIISREQGGGRGNSTRYRINLAYLPAAKTVPPSDSLRPERVPPQNPLPSQTVSPQNPSGPANSSMVGAKSPTIEPDSILTPESRESGAAPPRRPPTPEELLYREGLPILGFLLESEPNKCRGFMGTLRQTIGDRIGDRNCPRLLMILQQAVEAAPSEPRAWLIAACQSRDRAKPTRRPAQNGAVELLLQAQERAQAEGSRVVSLWNALPPGPGGH